MKGWKRRSRGIKKMQRKCWFHLYLIQGVELREVYNRHRKYKLRNKRADKAEMDVLRNEAEGKTHYEDCFYHPCLITLLDFDNDNIEGISLIDGTKPRSCSFRHCGVTFFTEDEATRRADYIKEHGFESYYEQYDTF